MQIYSGHSAHHDVIQAAKEACAQWPDSSMFQKGIIFCFYPDVEQSERLAEFLAQQFPKVMIVASSSAGQWLDGQHFQGELVIMGIVSEQLRWSAIALDSLAELSQDSLIQSLQPHIKNIPDIHGKVSAKKLVCLTLIDGLSLQEEHLSAMLSICLQGIPVLGGSSADAGRFEQTSLLIQTSEQPCRVLRNSAIVLLLDSDYKLQPFHHQHFSASSTELVITSATPKKRVVHTLNGISAAACYARSVGCSVADLCPDIFSDYPLIYCYQEDMYVRSIQRLENDESLRFFCSIDEGMILNLGIRKPIEETLTAALTKLEPLTEKPKAALIFNCILRTIESNHLNQTQSIAQHLNAYSPKYIGFDTYGEQWQGKHMNQSLAMLVIS